MNRRKDRILAYYIFFGLAFSFGLVFAILQANLQINGTTKIADNTWDVHFENIVVTSGSVAICTGDTAATIDSNNDCKVDFSVTLSLPGDFYEFTVEAVNDGTIDAMIGTLDKTLKVNNVTVSEIPNYLIYTITYEDGVEILENHILAKNTSEIYKVRVEFKTDIDEEDLPDATTLSMGFEPVYIQADSTAIPVSHPRMLDDGMIPVTIANDGTVTTVSKDDDSWYDYENQIWANAVLVKENGVKTREQNKVVGTIINPDDILAYFVWIPRYSYKIWTIDASGTHQGQEQTIDIKFVDMDTKETGTTVGSWYTHPAFTFGGKELSGFWVGKFESSTDTSSSCYSTPTSDNCNNANQSPRIVPNVKSLINQRLSNQFVTSLKFAGGTLSESDVVFAGSTTYGLTNHSDTHVMKNSEWGAVAYLSHSVYGVNAEIRINNFYVDSGNQFKTGCGASTPNESSSGTCGIPYGSSTAYPQSTTGNISGVFDMSGGAWEFVMGNYNGLNGSSGFTTFPPSKYYDLYSSSIFTGDSTTNMTFCTLSTCGGHALNETARWHGDYAAFADATTPWLARGGHYSGGGGAGAFYSYNIGGGGLNHGSWRGVCVVK